MSGKTSSVVEYRKEFARITAAFFAVWAVIAIGLHLPARMLYQLGRINGAPLNWWMIQVSIALGIVLAFAYAYVMNKIEEKYETRR